MYCDIGQCLCPRESKPGTGAREIWLHAKQVHCTTLHCQCFPLYYTTLSTFSTVLHTLSTFSTDYINTQSVKWKQRKYFQPWYLCVYLRMCVCDLVTLITDTFCSLWGVSVPAGVALVCVSYWQNSMAFVHRRKRETESKWTMTEGG